MASAALARRSILSMCAYRWVCGAPSVVGSRRLTSSGEYATPDWAEHEYLTAANTTLEAIYEGALDAGSQDAFGDDWDVESAGGIVKVDLGERGQFVANTQTPNRQIWLSSPVSGPWRFDWDIRKKGWYAKRDGSKLVDMLEDELSDLAEKGIRVRINIEDGVG